MTTSDLCILTHLYSSPCGDLLLGAFRDNLCLCDWVCNQERRREVDARIVRTLSARLASEEGNGSPLVFEAGTSPVIERTISRLDEYFAGVRCEFRDIPLLLLGTPFQQTVWYALQTIPYGQTLSYAALAARIGRPSAVRAVATANRNNPLSILIPCHRVIGTSGSLVGYAGGLEAKRRLLELEAGMLRFF